MDDRMSAWLLNEDLLIYFNLTILCPSLKYYNEVLTDDKLLLYRADSDFQPGRISKCHAKFPSRTAELTGSTITWSCRPPARLSRRRYVAWSLPWSPHPKLSTKVFLTQSHQFCCTVTTPVLSDPFQDLNQAKLSSWAQCFVSCSRSASRNANSIG